MCAANWLIDTGLPLHHRSRGAEWCRQQRIITKTTGNNKPCVCQMPRRSISPHVAACVKRERLGRYTVSKRMHNPTNPALWYDIVILGCFSIHHCIGSLLHHCWDSWCEGQLLQHSVRARQLKHTRAAAASHPLHSLSESPISRAPAQAQGRPHAAALTPSNTAKGGIPQLRHAQQLLRHMLLARLPRRRRGGAMGACPHQASIRLRQLPQEAAFMPSSGRRR